MGYRFPADVLPSGVIRVDLFTAHERDVCLEVLNGEDITKWLGIEETMTEGNFQETVRKEFEVSTNDRSFSKKESRPPSI